MSVKRVLDVIGSTLGIFVSSPVMLVAAIAIKTDDAGPVLYRQERIGRGGRPFSILKFRTMTVGAEHRGLGLAVSENDDRITRTGSLLRATSLDELPQLFNILRGEMSLVGPRPTLRGQVERYDDFQRRRLDVLPGLTGWAQINGRNALTWVQRIELDVWYVEHASLLLDLKILARTPAALLVGRSGLYGESGVTTDL